MWSFELEQTLEARTVELPTLITLNPQINTRGHLSPVLTWKQTFKWKCHWISKLLFCESAIQIVFWIFSKQHFSNKEKKNSRTWSLSWELTFLEQWSQKKPEEAQDDGPMEGWRVRQINRQSQRKRDREMSEREVRVRHIEKENGKKNLLSWCH